MRKAPCGGVFIFANLAQKTEKKKPTHLGLFPRNPWSVLNEDIVYLLIFVVVIFEIKELCSLLEQNRNSPTKIIRMSEMSVEEFPKHEKIRIILF